MVSSFSVHAEYLHFPHIHLSPNWNLPTASLWAYNLRRKKSGLPGSEALHSSYPPIPRSEQNDSPSCLPYLAGFHHLDTIPASSSHHSESPDCPSPGMSRHQSVPIYLTHPAHKQTPHKSHPHGKNTPPSSYPDFRVQKNYEIINKMSVPLLLRNFLLLQNFPHLHVLRRISIITVKQMIKWRLLILMRLFCKTVAV